MSGARERHNKTCKKRLRRDRKGKGKGGSPELWILAYTARGGCGMKSSPSPGYPAGSFTEFIFNEVAVFLALLRLRPIGTVYFPYNRAMCIPNNSLFFFLGINT